MKAWLIEPRDSVIFRNGRPFNASPGARAKTLSYPFPSTIIGAARTRVGRDKEGHFNASLIDDLLRKKLRGPLLVELDEGGQVVDWFFPTPADALLLRHEPYKEDKARLVPLTVLDNPPSVSTDLTGLKLVGTVANEPGKPHPKAPTFWQLKKFKAWLLEPKTYDDVQLEEMGIPGLVRESRMHVSIADDTQTAEDGALFQTAGLEFTILPQGPEAAPPLLADGARLSLAIQTDAALSPGLGFLGGERRIARWSPLDGGFPPCPEDVRKKIKTDNHCRLILLTSALFNDGYMPGWIKGCASGVTVSIEAAAVNRYQTVSGWDYDKRLPKPTRRLAPAGSVYFLKLNSDADGATDRFINAVWMHNISDDPQDRLDGFGLAVLGVWDGVPKNMEMTK